jgi:hypothetical protein
MTKRIEIVQATTVNGMSVAPGSSQTVSDDVADDLVRQGKAKYAPSDSAPGSSSSDSAAAARAASSDVASSNDRVANSNASQADKDKENDKADKARVKARTADAPLKTNTPPVSAYPREAPADANPGDVHHSNSKPEVVKPDEYAKITTAPPRANKVVGADSTSSTLSVKNTPALVGTQE